MSAHAKAERPADELAGGGLPLFPWGLLGVLTVPLAILAVITYCRFFPPLIFGDVDYYIAALPALISDAPLYDPAGFRPHVLPPPPFWDQAPSTAIFTAILLLPAGKLIWGFLLIACVLGGLILILPKLGGGGVVLMAPVLAVLPPVIEASAWANLTSLVFVCLAVAWRWPHVAGYAIGVAVAAKLLPILAIAWLVGRRDWRGVAIAIAIPAAVTGLVMVLAGPGVILEFIIVRLNQSPGPKDARQLGLADLGVPEMVTWLLAVVIALLAARWVSFSLAVVAILVAAPALYMPYWILMLVPSFAIWIPWVLDRPRFRRPAPPLSARG